MIFGMGLEDIQYFMDQVLLPTQEVVIAAGLDPPNVLLRARVRTHPHLTSPRWLVGPHHSVVQVVATFAPQLV